MKAFIVSSAHLGLLRRWDLPAAVGAEEAVQLELEKAERALQRAQQRVERLKIKLAAERQKRLDLIASGAIQPLPSHFQAQESTDGEGHSGR